MEVSAGAARSRLRARLVELECKDAALHSLHDFRRGHAQDMVAAGADLGTILRAGQWSSPAFMRYLDVEQLEGAAVVEAHCAESSDDEGGARCCSGAAP